MPYINTLFGTYIQKYLMKGKEDNIEECGTSNDANVQRD